MPVVLSKLVLLITMFRVEASAAGDVAFKLAHNMSSTCRPWTPKGGIFSAAASWPLSIIEALSGCWIDFKNHTCNPCSMGNDYIMFP